jgi:hypothetical protein
MMKDRLIAAWKRLYATKLFYRCFWTTIQVSAGLLAAAQFDSPQLGVAVTLITTILTSLARDALAARAA